MMLSRFVIMLTLVIVGLSNGTCEELLCGYRKTEGFDGPLMVKSSKQAGLGEYPWTVALYTNNSMFCSGSLILPTVVLTAAHCVKYIPTEDITVHAGVWDVNLDSDEYPIQKTTVVKNIAHPNYTNNRSIITNDIAILVLNEAISLNDYIGLACLATSDFEVKEKNCLVAGWGKINFNSPAIEDVLKNLSLPYMSPEDGFKKLNEKLMGTVELSKDAIFAGGDKDTTCMGDGGAALVCPVNSSDSTRLIEIGITSWGVGCLPDFPGVFTSVSFHRKWIDEEITNLQLDPNSYTIN